MSSYEDANSYSDPWLNTIIPDNVTKEFEDKFVTKAGIVPLEDSQSYIAALERKLTKLKHGNKNQKQQLLRAVENTRDSYMRRLISSNSRDGLNVNQDTHLEEPVAANLINSWIKPEQALIVGELAELLKNDSLSTTDSENFEQ